MQLSTEQERFFLTTGLRFRPNISNDLTVGILSALGLKKVELEKY